jgi:hypothetical protein
MNVAPRPAPEVPSWRKALTLGISLTAVLAIAMVALPFGALSVNGRPPSC